MILGINQFYDHVNLNFDFFVNGQIILCDSVIRKGIWDPLLTGHWE